MFISSDPSVSVLVPAFKGSLRGSVVLSMGGPFIRVAVLSLFLWDSHAVSFGSLLVGNSPPIVFMGCVYNDFFVISVLVSSSNFRNTLCLLRVIRHTLRQCMAVAIPFGFFTVLVGSIWVFYCVWQLTRYYQPIICFLLLVVFTNAPPTARWSKVSRFAATPTTVARPLPVMAPSGVATFTPVRRSSPVRVPLQLTP